MAIVNSSEDIFKDSMGYRQLKILINLLGILHEQAKERRRELKDSELEDTLKQLDVVVVRTQQLMKLFEESEGKYVSKVNR